MNKPQVAARVWRWLLLFQEFDFERFLRSGKTHVLADHLSRIQSGEPATGIDDDLPKSFLFQIAATSEWYTDVLHLLSTGSFPSGLSPLEKRRLLCKSKPYTLIGGHLYKSGPEGILRRCVHQHEVSAILEDAHSSPAGGHYPGHITAQRILQAGLW